jgi:hypothetical protein
MARNFTGSAVGLLLLICALTVSQAFAQKTNRPQWEYASLSAAYLPFTNDNQSAVITAGISICYLQMDGCRNEEVLFTLNYGKFLQDLRFDNNSRSKAYAQQKAMEGAFAKAAAKLGLDGWEMMGSPQLQFNTYVQNESEGYRVIEGSQERKADIFFKRSKSAN